MKIENDYLMWAGSEHYKTIESWTEEATRLGVSKRVPNAAIARKLAQPGTVVFVAHDEGEVRDCEKCTGELEDPERRKLKTRKAALDKEVRAAYEEIRCTPFSEIPGYIGRGARNKVKRRMSALKEVEERLQAKPDTIRAGTGGHVRFPDGTIWDYRKYTYWLHRPKLWAPPAGIEKSICEHCGGKGTMPLTRIFGLFVPQRSEYVLGEEDIPTRKLHEALADVIVTSEDVAKEPVRRCGKRKPGGAYVVTSPDDSDGAAKATLEEMIRERIRHVGAVEIKGAFVRFLEPISVEGVKRFRGVKKWNRDPGVDVAARDIADAME